MCVSMCVRARSLCEDMLSLHSYSKANGTGKSGLIFLSPDEHVSPGSQWCWQLRHGQSHFTLFLTPACRGAGGEGEEIDSRDRKSSSPALQMDRTRC